MLTHWNTYCAQVAVSDEKLEEFIETSGMSSAQLKKLEKFTKEWNKAKNLAEAFDQFISPVDPIKVESPFDQEDFRYIWKTWKEYLQEQHGVLMRSRSEQMALDHLADISENNADVAIKILRVAMAGRYPRFFKVDQKESSNPSKQNNDGSDW